MVAISLSDLRRCRRAAAPAHARSPDSAPRSRRCRRRRAAPGRGRRAAPRSAPVRRRTARGCGRRTSAAAAASQTKAASSGWLMLALLWAAQLEPVEPVTRQGQQVGQLTDRRKLNVPGHLDRRVPGPVLQVQLDRLREPGQVVDAEHGVLPTVCRPVRARRPAPTGWSRPAHGTSRWRTPRADGAPPASCASSSAATWSCRAGPRR